MVPAINPPIVVAPVVIVATPEVPEVVPEDKPEEVPDDSPDEVPEEVPEVVPEEEPEVVPDEEPDDEPDDDPDEDPELPDARAVFGMNVDSENPMRAMVAAAPLGFLGMGVSYSAL
jgi:hypothetical protein